MRVFAGRMHALVQLLPHRNTTRGTIRTHTRTHGTRADSTQTFLRGAQLRNLTAGEILSQVVHAKLLMDDFPTVQDIAQRKHSILKKRQRLRQQFASYFRGSASQGNRFVAPREQEAVTEEPKRSITNIVFMVRCVRLLLYIFFFW
jgi:hypothetical protein